MSIAQGSLQVSLIFGRWVHGYRVWWAAISFIVTVLSGMNIYEPMTLWGPPVFLLPELQAMINP